MNRNESLDAEVEYFENYEVEDTQDDLDYRSSLKLKGQDEQLHDAFVGHDKGNKSYVTRAELHGILKEVTGRSFDPDHIETLYAEFDKNQDSKIDFPELQKMVSYLDIEKKVKMGARKSITINELNFGQSTMTSFDMPGIIEKAVKNSKKESEVLLRSIAKSLINIKDILCIQDDTIYETVRDPSSMHNSMMLDFNDLMGDDDSSDDEDAVDMMDPDFKPAYLAADMRCLALVSHNGMKKTMRAFVLANKNLLKKFRLTGTNSTMTMLREVFKDEPAGTVVFGPACASGPLGGDAELVAHMVSGKIGGIIFFQDPMDAHPHRVDIDCLVRQALVHNVMMAETPSSALMICQCLRQALIGRGRAELIPSFFFSLQSPTVEEYKKRQKAVVQSHKKD